MEHSLKAKAQELSTRLNMTPGLAELFMAGQYKQVMAHERVAHIFMNLDEADTFRLINKTTALLSTRSNWGS